MTKLKIGVVEDEIIIADNICSTLQKLGYAVTEPAGTFNAAIEMIEEEQPDLLLLDIQLKGAKDGIDLAWKVKEDYQLPFIFLTANADAATIERAKKTEPPAYLVKPFTKDDLFTAIEICFHNFTQKKEPAPTTQNKPDSFLIKDAIFIKDGNYFHKINFKDIIYLESENVYVNVFTTSGKKILVRSSMQQYLENFDSNHFVQIHRSYVINVSHIQTINTENIIVGGASLPMGKTYRANLLSRIKLG